MPDHDWDSIRENPAVLRNLARQLDCEPSFPSIAAALARRRRHRPDPTERLMRPKAARRVVLEPYRGDLLVNEPLAEVLPILRSRGGQLGAKLPARKARTLAMYRLVAAHYDEFELLHRQARVEYSLDPNIIDDKTVRRTARSLGVELPR